ncbi:MAG TPA: 2-C-methyl-D-erythritol 2,4-cyclodiphosphate synthase [Steroidobacteraceae bacterium]|nr:2-C-methyl-D-erythritol 2,4-cyclodiphosphate synthase [Steroidobacteraceae bacterium]
MRTSLRVGQGYDVHAFGEGDHVTLGGVKIPHEYGIKAHSDGDVILHALCDALLGAAALGDIGMHFPDTDAKWKGANSRDLLRHVVSLLKAQSYEVVNADITLLAEVPRIGKYRDEMKANMASDMNIDVSQINVKATTSEGMGFIGKREGLACHAVVLIERV